MSLWKQKVLYHQYGSSIFLICETYHIISYFSVSCFISKFNLKVFLQLILYLFINYNTIKNYILIIYELNNFNHVLGVVSQAKVPGGSRTYDYHANSLAHYPLDYKDTQALKLSFNKIRMTLPRLWQRLLTANL